MIYYFYCDSIISHRLNPVITCGDFVPSAPPAPPHPEDIETFLVEGVTDIQWVGVGNAAQHLTVNKTALLPQQ